MLQGEVSSKERPINSLLEATVDFEHASKAIFLIIIIITLNKF